MAPVETVHGEVSGPHKDRNKEAKKERGECSHVSVRIFWENKKCNPLDGLSVGAATLIDPMYLNETKLWV